MRGEGRVALKAALRNGHFVLSYMRNRGDSAYLYIIESSKDLKVWKPAEEAVEEHVVEVDLQTEKVEVVYPVPVTHSDQRFVRLRVVRFQ